MGALLLVVLLVLVLGSLPVVPQRGQPWRRWGYYPSGLLGLVCLAVLLLLVVGKIPWGFGS